MARRRAPKPPKQKRISALRSPSIGMEALSALPIGASLGAAGRMAQSYTYAQAAGTGYYPQAQLGNYGTIAGGIIGGVAGFMIGGPPGAVAGATLGAGALGFGGNLLSGQITGQWSLQQAQMLAAVRSGIPIGTLGAYAGGVSGIADPIRMGSSLTAQGYYAGIAGNAAFLMGGMDTGAYSSLTKSILARYGNGNEAQAQAAFSALGPMAANPLYSGMLGSAFRNRKGLSDEAITGALLGVGAEGTFSALTALQDGRGISAFGRIRGSMLTAQLDAQSAGAGVLAGGSGVALAGASGAAIDSPRMQAAQRGYIDALEKNIQALETQANLVRASAAKGDKYAQAALSGYEAQIGQAQAGLSSFQQNVLIGTAERRYGRLSTAASLAGMAAERERYGLAPGAVAPSLGAFASTQRAIVADAGRTLGTAGLPEEMYEAARLRESAAQTALIGARQQEVFQAYGIPAGLSSGFAGRSMAAAMQGAAFGLGEEALGGLYGTGASITSRNVSRQRALLGAMQRSGVFLPEQIDSQRTVLAAAELGRNAIGRASAYNASDFALRGIGQSGLMLGAESAYSALLGAGPAADLAISGRVARNIGERSLATLERAQLALSRGEGGYAADLFAEGQALGFQSRSARLAGYMSYRPSAADSAQLGRLQTAVALAQNDTVLGGQVPVGVRQQLLSAYAGQLGGIDAQIAGTPAHLRDAASAALGPQRNALLLGMQQERQALMYGDIGHLLNVSMGAPNGFNAFGGSSLRSLQAYDRGVSRGLGGNGSSVGMSDLVRLALQTPGNALGGTGQADPAILQLLTQIRDAVAAAGRSSGSGASVPAGTATRNNPLDQVRNRADGVLGG